MSEFVFRNPRFDALRSAFYHAERQVFFERVDLLLKFVIIALGASVVAKYLTAYSIANQIVEVGIVLLGLFHIVYDFGARACKHEMLKKTYLAILVDMDGGTERNQAPSTRVDSKFFVIACDETAHMRAVDALAFNKTISALGLNADDERIITLWQYFTCNLFTYGHHKFERRGNIRNLPGHENASNS